MPLKREEPRKTVGSSGRNPPCSNPQYIDIKCFTTFMPHRLSKIIRSFVPIHVRFPDEAAAVYTHRKPSVCWWLRKAHNSVVASSRESPPL